MLGAKASEGATARLQIAARLLREQEILFGIDLRAADGQVQGHHTGFQP